MQGVWLLFPSQEAFSNQQSAISSQPMRHPEPDIRRWAEKSNL